MVDVWKWRNPDAQPIRTYFRGSTRIDGIFVTPEVLPMICMIEYLPFQHNPLSDHRMIVVDFYTDRIFGSELQRMALPPYRGIGTGNPKAVAKYIPLVVQHLNQNRFFTDLEQLTTSNTPDHKMAEKLDGLLTQACKSAEDKCRRSPRPWWSVKLNKQRILVATINHWRQCQLRNKDKIASLNQRLQRIGSEHTLSNDIQETRQMLRQARIDLKQMRKDAKQLREQELLERHRMKSAQPTTRNDAKVLQQLMSKERLIEMIRKFRLARQGRHSEGINRIEIPEDWDEEAAANPESLSEPKEAHRWKSVDVPEEIEKFLTARNTKHFRQAKGTPFTIHPLSTEIDWAAASTTAELVLEGEYSNKDLDEATQLLLKHCQRVTELDTIKNEITGEEFRTRFKTWNEKTTTSPSGRHLGHFKALLAPVAHSKAEQVKQGQALLIDAQVQLINYALRFGYSYQRWQDVVNVMIWKQPGNCKVRRLRIIHLYEADYNFILGLKWKQTLYQAVREQTVHPDQHGGRPGRDAASLALFEEIKTDICYAEISFDNDAASCYDRIIPNLASLAARKFGLHRKVVQVNANTLENTRFRLKTATGVSKQWISHSEEQPIYGTGQGSGNSPVIWGLISSILFSAHSERSHGATFVSPDGSQTVKVSMVGFVDDSTGQANAFDAPQENIETVLIQMMQHDAQLWAELLVSSGGKLELDKCSFHLLVFKCDASGKPQPDTMCTRIVILEITDRITNQVHRITAKSPYDPHKTLGHWKAPAGNSIAQYQSLTEKCQNLPQALSVSMT